MNAEPRVTGECELGGCHAPAEVTLRHKVKGIQASYCRVDGRYYAEQRDDIEVLALADGLGQCPRCRRLIRKDGAGLPAHKALATGVQCVDEGQVGRDFWHRLYR